MRTTSSTSPFDIKSPDATTDTAVSDSDVAMDPVSGVAYVVFTVANAGGDIHAARRAGKAWGMPSFSPAHARELLDHGARFLAHGADILMVKDGLEAIRRGFGPLGFTFDGRL